MKLEMRGRETDWTEQVRRHAERRLRYALSRFSRTIGLVSVRILDAHDARGGVEKTCRIVVSLLPNGRIVVEETDGDVLAALERAADRAGRAVGCKLSRERDPEMARAAARPEGGA